MKGQEIIYTKEDRFYLIELKLTHIQQLFNSLDPSPFREKDLAPSAEDYIVGTAGDFSFSTPLKLVIHLSDNQITEEQIDNTSKAIHNYFEYRSMVMAHEQRQLLQNGRTALFIGLLFLFFCILAQHGITALGKEGLLWSILEEGFLISGWVAMWHPINLFLYEWWPYRRRKHLFHKLAHIPIEIRSSK